MWRWRETAASRQLAQGISCGSTSICFSKRISFQSPGRRHEGVAGLAGEADHGVIGAQGVAEQAVGAERSRAAFEIFQQRLADAVALPAVVDRQAEFDAAVLERVAGFADDDLMAVDQHGRDHAEAVGFADMDEILEHRRRQFAARRRGNGCSGSGSSASGNSSATPRHRAARRSARSRPRRCARAARPNIA